MDPHGSQSAIERGWSLCESGEFAEAAEAFVEAATKDPSDAEARRWLGYAYERLGRDDDALEQYEAGLQLAPDDAHLKQSSARIHAKRLAAVESLGTIATSVGDPAPRRSGMIAALAAMAVFLVVLVVGGLIAVRTLGQTGRARVTAEDIPTDFAQWEGQAPAPADAVAEPSMPAGDMAGLGAAPGAGDSPEGQLKSTLADLRAAVQGFHAKYGCYPAALEDVVAANPPSHGIDAAGDSVPIDASAYTGPTLQTGDGLLPVDPVIGGRSSWVYETAPPKVGDVRSGAIGVAPDGTSYNEF